MADERVQVEIGLDLTKLSQEVELAKRKLRELDDTGKGGNDGLADGYKESNKELGDMAKSMQSVQRQTSLVGVGLREGVLKSLSSIKQAFKNTFNFGSFAKEFGSQIERTSRDINDNIAKYVDKNATMTMFGGYSDLDSMKANLNIYDMVKDSLPDDQIAMYGSMYDNLTASIIASNQQTTELRVKTEALLGALKMVDDIGNKTYFGIAKDIEFTEETIEKLTGEIELSTVALDKYEKQLEAMKVQGFTQMPEFNQDGIVVGMLTREELEEKITREKLKQVAIDEAIEDQTKTLNNLMTQQGLIQQKNNMTAAWQNKFGTLFGKGQGAKNLEETFKNISGILDNVSGKLGGIGTKFGDIGAKLTKSGSSLASSLAKTATSTGGLAKLIPIVAGVIAMVAASIAIVVGWIKIFKTAVEDAQAAVETFRASASTGLNAETYQKSQFVFQLTGMDESSIDQAMKKFRNNISKKGDLFAELGVNTAQSIDDIYQETLTKIAGIADEQERLNYLYEIFGKSATGMNTQLQQGSEALEKKIKAYEALLTMDSEEETRQAEEWAEVKAMFKEAAGAWKETFSGLMPIITKVIARLTLVLAYCNTIFQFLMGNLNGDKNNALAATEESAENTLETVEKIKGSLQGFDEMNVLSFNDTSDTEEDMEFTASLDSESMENLAWLEEKLAKLKDWQDKLANTDWQWVAVASGALAVLLGTIMAIGGFCTGNLPLALLGLSIAGFGVMSLANNWDFIKEKLSGLGDWFKECGEKIGEWLGKAWEAIKNFFKWCGEKIAEGWDALCDWFEDVGEWLGEVWDDICVWFEDVCAGVGEFFSGVWDGITEFWDKYCAPVFTAQFWKDLWEIIVTAVSEKVTEIKEKFEEKVNAIKDWWKDNMAEKFTAEYWRNKWENAKQAMTDKLQEYKDGFKEKVEAVKTWFSDNISKYFKKDYWLEKWDNIKQGAMDKIDGIKSGIKEKWESIKSWVNDHILCYFKVSWWSEKFASISEGLKYRINCIICHVQNGINRIIEKLNNNGIVQWLGKAIGNTDGTVFSYITIPQLATGGYVDKPTFAQIGEAGPEVVLPLSANNSQWMDVLINRMNEQENSMQPTTIVLELDGRQLAKTVVNDINKVRNSGGRLTLAI